MIMLYYPNLTVGAVVLCTYNVMGNIGDAISLPYIRICYSL